MLLYLDFNGLISGVRKTYSVEEGEAKKHLNKPGIHKPMGPDGMQPSELRVLADVVALLSLKGYGDWRRFPRNGRNQMSSLSSTRARRRIQETTSWPASPPSL